jgi:hypothetical protein
MIAIQSLFGRRIALFYTFVFVVAKPKELAAMIMKNDKNGIRQDKTAMNSGEE